MKHTRRTLFGAAAALLAAPLAKLRAKPHTHPRFEDFGMVVGRFIPDSDEHQWEWRLDEDYPRQMYGGRTRQTLLGCEHGTWERWIQGLRQGGEWDYTDVSETQEPYIIAWDEAGQRSVYKYATPGEVRRCLSDEATLCEAAITIVRIPKSIKFIPLYAEIPRDHWTRYWDSI